MPIARYARKEAQEEPRTAPRFMTVWHVADWLGVNERTVRRWLASGALAGLELGGKGYRIPKGALIDFMCRGGYAEAHS